MVKIKFTAQGSNSLVGGFSHGMISRVTEALAKHLVEEAKVAVYQNADASAVQEGKTEKQKAIKKKKVTSSETPEVAAVIDPPVTAEEVSVQTDSINE